MMSTALKALAAAKEARIAVEVEGEKLVLRGQDLFNEVTSARSSPAKPDLMRVHRGQGSRPGDPQGTSRRRDAGRTTGRAPGAAFSTPLCRRDGAIRRRSSAGQSMNCTKNRPSGDASRSHRRSAFDRRAEGDFEVAEAHITIKGLRGTELKFRRAGKEHLP